MAVRHVVLIGAVWIALFLIAYRPGAKGSFDRIVFGFSDSPAKQRIYEHHESDGKGNKTQNTVSDDMQSAGCFGLVVGCREQSGRKSGKRLDYPDGQVKVVPGDLVRGPFGIRAFFHPILSGRAAENIDGEAHSKGEKEFNQQFAAPSIRLTKSDFRGRLRPSFGYVN
jgi:hypothetical protein